MIIVDTRTSGHDSELRDIRARPVLEQPERVRALRCSFAGRGLCLRNWSIQPTALQPKRLHFNRKIVSTINGRFQFLSSFPKREFDVLRRAACGAPDKLAGRVIQSGAQVMQGITNDQRNAIGDVVGDSELEGLPTIRLFLGREFVRVTLDKGVDGRVQFSDVLIGPFDL